MKEKVTNIFKRPRKEQEISSQIIETDNMQERLLLHNALSFAANNTIEQMIKCKDVVQMNDLSIKREKQNSLSFKANNIETIMIVDLSDISIIQEALAEYKNKIVIDVKKSNCTAEEFDALCEEIYICNKFMKQFPIEESIEENIEE